jgi:hypothetical protein
MNPHAHGEPNLPRKPAGKGWLIWIFIGLAPIPIGLLIGPAKIFNASENQNNPLWLSYVALTGICSLLCGIGQAGGFRSRKASDFLWGSMIGVIIGTLNFGVVFFAGCCSALTI